jgi:hypothetical protein
MKTSFQKFSENIESKKINLAASDKLDTEYKKLFEMEKSITSSINALKNQIDAELKKVMVQSDSVIFEYEGLKDSIIALVGEQGAKSWDSANNGKLNYSISVQKSISDFRKKLDAFKYLG